MERIKIDYGEVNSYTRVKRVDDLDNVVDYKNFLELLQYERVRSDRSNEAFSLIIFESKKNMKNSDDLVEILSIIKPTLRTIDHVGWYGSRSIAILLPLIDCREVSELVIHLKRQFLLKSLDFPIDSHTYPEDWFVHEADRDKGDLTPWKKRDQQNEVGSRVATALPFWKRSLDIVGSSLILLMLSPLLILTAIFIKVVSPGSMFFTQDRVGHRGKTFKFYKFRSMHESNNEAIHGKHAQSFIKDGNVPMIKLDTTDPRIITGGGFLRSSCIDELPQLLNVFIGDMSLVGPRPCIPYEAEEYLRWHTHRFDTVPGMTGLWQVSGKNDLTFQQMVRLDITYSRNLSFLNDIKILFMTIPTVFKLLGKYYGKFVKKIENKDTNELEIDVATQ